MKSILWIDDDLSLFTGLQAYLSELESVKLLSGRSMDEAMALLDRHKVDLLLLDMVLMQDHDHAALGRRTGISLARFALDYNVSSFMVYTVLTEQEVFESWNLLKKAELKARDATFTYFNKTTASVMEIVEAVKDILFNGFGG